MDDAILVDALNAIAGRWQSLVSSGRKVRRLGPNCGQRRLNDSELIDLRSDLEIEIAKLPTEQQTLLLLLKTHSLNELSEVMEVPRTTLIDWLSNIRETFEKAGGPFSTSPAYATVTSLYVAPGPVPEPSTALMSVVGLLGLVVYRKRMKT